MYLQCDRELVSATNRCSPQVAFRLTKDALSAYVETAVGARSYPQQKVSSFLLLANFNGIVYDSAMKFLTTLTTAIAFALLSSSVNAHPGHGVPEEQVGVWHYIMSAQHFLPIVTLALSLFVIALRKRRVSSPAKSVG